MATTGPDKLCVAFHQNAAGRMWSQESFTTPVRSTAQRTIISVARVMAAVLALVTPRLAAAGPQGLFLILTLMIVIGMGAAIPAFHGGRRNEFTVEDELAEPTTTMPA
jgi:inositol transporter-like SP family MFS transporter